MKEPAGVACGALHAFAMQQIGNNYGWKIRVLCAVEYYVYSIFKGRLFNPVTAYSCTEFIAPAMMAAS